MKSIFAEQAMLAGGWDDNVTIDVDDEGSIAAVRTRQKPSGAERAGGPVIPGDPMGWAFISRLAGGAEGTMGQRGARS